MIPLMVWVALAFLAGLLIGSFLNVCVFRLPRDLSVVSPSRSFCPECERMIAWYDNIPVVSYLMLGGKCRYCKQPIGWRYPFVELATGVLFAVMIAVFGPTLEGIKYCVYAAILVDLIATDFEERILPDEFTLGGVVVGLVFAYFVPLQPVLANFLFPSLIDTPWLSVAESAIGASVVSILFWGFATLYGKLRKKEMLGLGDVKMIAMIGAFVGLPLVMLTLMLGALLGSIVGGAFILIARKEAGSYELPLGSFLGVAAVAVVFWGHFVG